MQDISQTAPTSSEEQVAATEKLLDKSEELRRAVSDDYATLLVLAYRPDTQQLDYTAFGLRELSEEDKASLRRMLEALQQEIAA